MATRRQWSDLSGRTRGLLVSVRGADGLRFSLHFFNNDDDIEGLLETWREGP